MFDSGSLTERADSAVQRRIIPDQAVHVIHTYGCRLVVVDRGRGQERGMIEKRRLVDRRIRIEPVDRQVEVPVEMLLGERARLGEESGGIRDVITPAEE